MTTSKAARTKQRLEDHGQLLKVLARHVEQDPSSVPCLQRHCREDWTSNRLAALNRAAAACRTCPALQACKDYADKWEKHGAGVWAGKIRGRPEPPEDPPTQPSTQTVIEQLQNPGGEHRPHNTRKENNK